MGSKATLIITSTAFPIDGDYKLRWSPTATFVEDDTVILVEGSVPKNGYEVSVTFTVPEATYDKNFIQYLRLARDDPVAMPFFVLPSIEVIPDSAIPGTTVKIKGTGFPEDDSSILTFDGNEIDLDLTTNEVGTFAVDFTIPETIAGKHKFVVDNPNIYDEILESSLEVKPFVTMDPERPEIGTLVTISGRGFAGNSQINIKYDDIDITDSPTTNEIGSFIFEFAIPETSETEHVITVSDEANNVKTLGLPLEGDAPPKPLPLKPKDDRFGILVFDKQTIEFSWRAVADTSGISYTVEVGENLNFFPLKPGMKKSGLTQNICTFDIEPGTYYWRVRAVDGAGNAGEWAISPFPFKVGLLSIWSIVAGALIFVVIFILLLRAFFRRLKEYY